MDCPPGCGCAATAGRSRRWSRWRRSSSSRSSAARSRRGSSATTARRPFPYATNAALKPVGPWTHVPATDEVNLDSTATCCRRTTHAKQALLVLGADGPLGRDELIRVLDGARTSLEIALGAVLVALLIAIPVGSVAGYFGGVDRRRRLALHRDRDGVPAAALPRLRDREAEPVAARRLVQLGPAVGRLRRGAPDRRLHVVLSDAPRPRAAPDAAQRGVRRGRLT